MIPKSLRLAAICLSYLSLLFGPCLLAANDAAGEFASALGAYGQGDFTRAFLQLRSAANAGHAEAQFHLGVMQVRGEGTDRDLAGARASWTLAAEQGHAKAQYNLSYLYAKGIGTGTDSGRAVIWYSRAAEQGYAPAQYNLGQMYFRGEGLTASEANAAHWFEAASLQGHPWAQENLGTLYVKGRGVEQDLVRAYAWLTLSATQDNMSAWTKREDLEMDLTFRERLRAGELAARLHSEIRPQ